MAYAEEAMGEGGEEGYYEGYEQEEMAPSRPMGYGGRRGPGVPPPPAGGAYGWGGAYAAAGGRGGAGRYVPY